MTADPNIRAQAATVLARLSLPQKVGQLNQVWAEEIAPGTDPVEQIRQGQVGSMLYVLDPAKANALQRIAVEESAARIPLLFGSDVAHGFRTIFPVSLALAASWDPQVVVEAQTIAAKEARAAGLHWTFYPMVDIARDPRWGRIVEGVGEDPFLGSAMAAAHVRGLQGAMIGDADHLMATAKHFVGYGAAEGGRDYDPVSLSQTELHNIYLPPFKAAVDAGVASIMSAYMDLNDVPPTADPGLLRDLLRARWGFQGVVISDASTIANLVVQGFAKDSSEAALRAIQAGVDVDLGSGVFLQELVGLVESGALPEQVIDDAVLPVLEMKVRMGLFDDPYVDERRLEHVAADPAHRTAARRAAQRSIVLLKNEGGVLPLKPTSGLRVAVVGPWADSRAAVEGIGDPFGAGPSAVTVLEAVRAKLPGAVVEHAAGPAVARTIRPFYEDAMPAMFPWRTKTEQEQADADAAMVDAVQTAQRADLVIAVVGETDDMSSEYSSRAHLDLPGRQQELLQHLGSLGKPVVVVLLGGRPLSVTWAAEHLPVLLQAWQLGHEGGTAIADVLFGEVNPGGKLPVTIPRSVGQVPIHYDRNVTHWPESSPAYRSRYFDSPTTPLFPFGFGLSYTRFSFSNLELSDDAISIGGHLTIAVELTNTGDVAGDEVAQLYIHQRHGRASRPQRQLKGFQRVTLQPAETTTVRFTLGPDELQYWSGAAEDFVQDVTTFDVWVGADSAADLHDEFSVTA